MTVVQNAPSSSSSSDQTYFMSLCITLEKKVTARFGLPFNGGRKKVSDLKVCCLWWRLLAQAPIMLIFETMIAKKQKKQMAALAYRFYLISTPALTCISFLPSKRIFQYNQRIYFKCLVDQRKMDIVADSLLLLSFVYSLEALTSKEMRQTWAVGVWRKMPWRCQRVRGQVGWRP